MRPSTPSQMRTEFACGKLYIVCAVADAFISVETANLKNASVYLIEDLS